MKKRIKIFTIVTLLLAGLVVVLSAMGCASESGLLHGASVLHGGPAQAVNQEASEGKNEFQRLHSEIYAIALREDTWNVILEGFKQGHSVDRLICLDYGHDRSPSFSNIAVYELPTGEAERLKKLLKDYPSEGDLCWRLVTGREYKGFKIHDHWLNGVRDSMDYLLILGRGSSDLCIDIKGMTQEQVVEFNGLYSQLLSRVHQHYELLEKAAEDQRQKRTEQERKVLDAFLSEYR
jgi:hypothetical protein